MNAKPCKAEQVSSCHEKWRSLKSGMDLIRKYLQNFWVGKVIKPDGAFKWEERIKAKKTEVETSSVEIDRDWWDDGMSR